MIHVGIECGEFDAMLYLTRQLDDLKTKRIQEAVWQAVSNKGA